MGSPKDMHLKPEKWKYKTRKKRKKCCFNCNHDEFSESFEKRVISVVEDARSVDNCIDMDLQAVRTKYIKMNKVARQSENGRRLYAILNGVRKLDSAGNSENQSKLPLMMLKKEKLHGRITQLNAMCVEK